MGKPKCNTPGKSRKHHRVARRTARRTVHRGWSKKKKSTMSGGSKDNSPFLGYGWTGQASSWPGVLNKTTPTCSGIMQSNYYPLSPRGISSGIPLATNTLHGGWRKSKGKTMRSSNSRCNKSRSKSRCNKSRSKSRCNKSRSKVKTRQYKGGGRDTIFPDAMVNLLRKAASIPLTLASTWRGQKTPANLDPYPYHQPIDKASNLHPNVGYKLNPAQLQNRAPNSAFTN